MKKTKNLVFLTLPLTPLLISGFPSMEIVDVPSEILDKIFGYLDHKTLWICLHISKRWRDYCNSNRLWRIQCYKLEIQEPLISSILLSECGSLCLWATTYATKYLLLLKNWKNGHFCLKVIPKLNFYYVDAWVENMGAIYYYLLEKLVIYEVEVDNLKYFEIPCFTSLTKDIYSISIKLSNSYVAVSNYNLIIVYKKTPIGYDTFRVVAYHNKEITFLEYSEDFFKSVFSVTVTLQVKSIKTKYLWFNGDCIDYLYVVDIESKEIKMYEDISYIREYRHCPYIANWSADKVNLYADNGLLIFHHNVHCWNLSFNKELIAFGNKSNQTVEVWDIRTHKILATLKVVYTTEIQLSPIKNVLILVEKSTTVYRITFLDAKEGSILWQTYPKEFKRMFLDLEFVKNYVIFSHLISSNYKYYVLNVMDGKEVSEGDLSITSYFTDTLIICSDAKEFKIKNFLIF